MSQSSNSDNRHGLGTSRLGLPRGSRDLMPVAYRRRRAATQTLVEVFERWGYGPVMTPLVEYYDVLGRGLTEADRRLCVRFIEAGSGELVALRSDITPQIARMVAQRAGDGEDLIRRYCYAADVVRQSALGSSVGPAIGDQDQTETHQAGVELIGDADAAADAELVTLCDEALRAAGLQGFRIDLAHARIGHDLIDALALPTSATEQLRVLLARKDRGGVAQLVRRHDRSGPEAEAAVALCDLFGPVDGTRPNAAGSTPVLERARVALAGCGLHEGLDRLETVLSHVRAVDGSVLSRITLDLGEVRGFEYYTGLRLRVWAPGVGRPVARGGRYDDLLGRYGYAAPATGFAIDLDALEAALQHAGRARGTEPSPQVHVVAVASDGGAASRVQGSRTARVARAAGGRAWVVPAADLQHAKSQARAAGATVLTMVSAASTPELHTYERTADGWREVPTGERQDNLERER
jgi:ATP phosphoribosyltransferase regulatory subunit